MNTTEDVATLASVKPSGDAEVSKQAINDFFLLTMGMVVYFMQCGFAFLEAGAVRARNTTNILMKNMMDSFVGCIAYAIFGYGLSFGDHGNPFCGGGNFGLAYLEPSKYSFWFFEFVFAATAATIVSGAVAERCNMSAYLISSFTITGIIYPITSHWIWDAKGWLQNGPITSSGKKLFFMDYAGSGVVHLNGGILAFIAALCLGPRIGRFDADKKPQRIYGHSVPLAALGSFILFFGFLAFNGGSQLSIVSVDDGYRSSLAMVNTFVAASFGALTTTLLALRFGFAWSLLRTINGSLSAMVSICAGGGTVYPWAAAITGILAGLSCWLVSTVVLRLRVDDPLDAVAVHAGGGLVGLLTVPFFHTDSGIFLKPSAFAALNLVWQLVGILALTAWAVATGTGLFVALRLTKILRVDNEHERRGIDVPKHGEPAYPREAYEDDWPENYRRE